MKCKAKSWVGQALGKRNHVYNSERKRGQNSLEPKRDQQKEKKWKQNRKAIWMDNIDSSALLMSFV